MNSVLNEKELVIERTLEAPRDKVFAAWSSPAFMKEWFAPRPWTTSLIDMDFRSGGRFNTTMRSPEGEEYPGKGVFLEVVPNERIVFTDGYTEGWEPAEEHFMTAIIEFQDLGNGRTGYSVRVLHRNVDDLKKHEEMGFQQGWNQCIDQLEEFAKNN